MKHMTTNPSQWLCFAISAYWSSRIKGLRVLRPSLTLFTENGPATYKEGDILFPGLLLDTSEVEKFWKSHDAVVSAILNRDLTFAYACPCYGPLPHRGPLPIWSIGTSGIPVCPFCTTLPWQENLVAACFAIEGSFGKAMKTSEDP